jgi:hypothetical protein
LQESYLGKVKMIYIDPPYNTGHDFVYPDSFIMDNEDYNDGIGYFDKVIQFRNRPQSDPAYAYQDSTKKNIKAEIYNGEIGLSMIHGLDAYSKDGKQGWQNPDYTFEKMKRLLSTDIIRPYRQQIYGQKNVLRQDIKQTSKVKMDELIVKISQKEDYPENTYRMLMMLREELNKQKGKRVYGYLPQHVKSLVDNIVDELAKDPDISELLKHWNTLQGNLIALYKKDGYDPIPLSQMSEFKSVKNMIIQEAMNIPDDEFVPVSTKEITDDKPSVRNQHKTHFFSNLSIVFRRICNNSQPKQGKEKNQIEQDEEYERKLAQGMKV